MPFLKNALKFESANSNLGNPALYKTKTNRSHAGFFLAA